MEIIGYILALIFWWTFWNRLNRIMVAVESLAVGQIGLKNTVVQNVPSHTQRDPSSPVDPIVAGPPPSAMTEDGVRAEARRILQEFRSDPTLKTLDRELGPRVEVYTVEDRAPVVGHFPCFIESLDYVLGRQVGSYNDGRWVRIQKQIGDTGQNILLTDIKSIRRGEP